MANALQAVLDRAAQEPKDTPAEAATPRSAKAPAAKKARRIAALPAEPEEEIEAEEPVRSRHQRPVRDGKRFIGGHFDPEVARQLRIIAAEDDTTIQALLEEAVQLLFLKKGRDMMVASGPAGHVPKRILP